MALSGVSGSIEEDFFTKRQSPNANQVAAHAQKRVTVPLSAVAIIYSRTSPYGHLYNTGTSLLRTVLLVPEMPKILHSLPL